MILKWLSIYLLSPDSKKLLSAFKKAIDEEHITTWSYDKDGDFTHTTKQWIKAAWLKPTAENDRLVLYILPPASKIVFQEIYGIYHGRFIESMVVHCYNLFTQALATPLPTSNDKMKGSKA